MDPEDLTPAQRVALMSRAAKAMGEFATAVESLTRTMSLATAGLALLFAGFAGDSITTGVPPYGGQWSRWQIVPAPASRLPFLGRKEAAVALTHEVTDAELEAMVDPFFTVGLVAKVQHRPWRRLPWRVWELEASWYQRQPGRFGPNRIQWPISTSCPPVRIEGFMIFDAEGVGHFNRKMRFAATVGPPVCTLTFNRD